MNTTNPPRRIYNVSELTRLVKDLLENNLPRIWVEGEISNFSAAYSGHWYFTLKDEGAQLPCAMFKGRNRDILKPREGALVLLKGRINVYEPRGAYQLIADSMEDRGAGRLREAFEALKKRLGEEGLFDEEKKRPLPFLPRRIAIVTSPHGAAVHDMIRVIRRRNPKVSLVIAPTLVQGLDAPPEIVDAIGRAGRLTGVELVIVGRGGGSIEDLWAFNDESVARAIRACPVPVISAVGHEVDFTIADFAADLRAATPSSAGELAVPELSELEADLRNLSGRLGRAAKHRIVNGRLALRSLSGRLPSPERRLNDLRLTLDALTRRMSDGVGIPIRRHRMDIAGLHERLASRHPGREFERSRARFNEIRHRLVIAANQSFQNRKEILNRLALSLDKLSPLNVLKRGYALVTDEAGRVASDAGRFKAGDRLRAHFAKGELSARVESVSTGGRAKD